MAEQATKEPTMEEILASIRRIISEDGEPAESETIAEPSISETSEAMDVASPDTDAMPDMIDMGIEEDADDDHLLSVDDLLGHDDSLSEIEEFGDLEAEINSEDPLPVEPATVPPPSDPQSQLDELMSETDELDEILELDELPEEITAEPELPPAPQQVEKPARVADTIGEHPVQAPVTETPMPVADLPRATPLTDEVTATAAAGALGKLISTLNVKSDNTIEGLVREMLKPMIKEWLDDNLTSIVERKVEAEVQRISKMVS